MKSILTNAVMSALFSLSPPRDPLEGTNLLLLLSQEKSCTFQRKDLLKKDTTRRDKSLFLPHWEAVLPRSPQLWPRRKLLLLPVSLLIKSLFSILRTTLATETMKTLRSLFSTLTSTLDQTMPLPLRGSLFIAIPTQKKLPLFLPKQTSLMMSSKKTSLHCWRSNFKALSRVLLRSTLRTEIEQRSIYWGN